MTETKTKKSGSDLLVRIAAAAVLVPIALYAAWMGGVLFSLFIAVVGVITALEWTAMVAKDNKYQQYIHILAAISASFALFVPVSSPVKLELAILAMFWGLSVMRASNHGLNRWLFMGIPYISLPLLVLVLLRSDMANGISAIVLVFACVWTADTLAYFFGRTFGGPKLMPSVSPNKTWSGFCGAVLGGLIAAVLVFHVFDLNNVVIAGVIGAAIGGVEQGGDLYESAAKRVFGIKDSGKLIPGHGGVLDRVDGLMAAAVAAWLIGAVHTGNWQTAATGLMVWP